MIDSGCMQLDYHTPNEAENETVLDPKKRLQSNHTSGTEKPPYSPGRTFLHTTMVIAPFLVDLGEEKRSGLTSIEVTEPVLAFLKDTKGKSR